MEFPTTRPEKKLDTYIEEEIQRAIVETLVWVCRELPELTETFFEKIPPDILEMLCFELET